MDNPVIAGTMGKTGRQFVLDNFKWDVIVKRFLDFLKVRNGDKYEKDSYYKSKIRIRG